ncbi:flagellar motor protein MotA [Shigella flexneri]|nr:flagellar motor protein MotA [Shigella flexneri]
MSPFIGITSAALVSGGILLAGLGVVPAVAGGFLAFGIQRVITIVIAFEQ